MKNLILTLLVLVAFSCSDEKTDQELLEKDKKDLAEGLDSYKIMPYKFVKILLRASAEKDTISPEFQKVKANMDRISNMVLKYDFKDPESLSVMDYISIYRDYKNMEDYVMETDEDIFPPLKEVFNKTYGDSISNKKEYATSNDKIYVQNIEHAVLSAIVILSKDIGKELSLYECSKTKPELLPDSEIKALLQYFKGFLFFEKGLYYLSEDEISRNIDWLNENKDVDLPYTRAMFQWGNLSNEYTHLGFHSLNHLFRGFDRLMMDREIDEKRALEDFGMFLNNAKKIGLDSEIIWAIETYMYLKSEDNEKAINALEKLKTSNLLSSGDKEKIDESIAYVKDRKPGEALNGVYDKYFLSKIATKYMFSILAQVNWEKVMKDQNVPHTEEIFRTLEKVKVLIDNIDQYSSTENLKKSGEEMKKKAEGYWDDAKGLLDD